VDDVVLFKPLKVEEIKAIIELLAEQLRQRLEDRKIQLEISAEAKDFIVDAAYDPVYGARPLKRYLQRELETRIGRSIIAGDVADGSTVKVSQENGSLSLDIGDKKQAED